MLGPFHDTEALRTPRSHVQALSPCKQLPLATLSRWEYELCKEPAQTLEMGSGLFAQGILESWIARAWSSTQWACPLGVADFTPWRVWPAKGSEQDPLWCRVQGRGPSCWNLRVGLLLEILRSSWTAVAPLCEVPEKAVCPHSY